MGGNLSEEFQGSKEASKKQEGEENSADINESHKEMEMHHENAHAEAETNKPIMNEEKAES